MTCVSRRPEASVSLSIKWTAGPYELPAPFGLGFLWEPVEGGGPKESMSEQGGPAPYTGEPNTHFLLLLGVRWFC